MALASVISENQALDALTNGTSNVLAYVNLNSASTGTTGGNELPSSRQACSWNTASGGSKTNSTALTFTTPGNTAATYFSTWSASSGGNFGIGGALSSSVTATTITVAAGAISISIS